MNYPASQPRERSPDDPLYFEGDYTTRFPYVPPQAVDLQLYNDWDEQRLIAEGERLIREGVSDPPSNIEMHAFSYAERFGDLAKAIETLQLLKDLL